MRIYLCNLAAVQNYVLNVIYVVPKVSNANIKMENVTNVKLQERVKKMENYLSGMITNTSMSSH